MTEVNYTVPEGPVPTPELHGSQDMLRPARALIGWTRDEFAQSVLSTVTAAPAASEAAARARRQVEEREPGVDQTALVTDLPAELEGHVRALQASPAAAPMFGQGWQVRMVDLKRVCAIQPLVYTDRSFGDLIDTGDLAAVAAITLPLSAADQMSCQYDPAKKSYIIRSADLNLRVIGNVGPLPMQPHGAMVGFGVVGGPSYMQVAMHGGRYLLRDGYHRALWLLSRGITMVPAFVRELTVFEDLGIDPLGMLGPETYRGSRPPVLPDYLNDAVSAAVKAPGQRKMIIIQALEVTPVG